MKRIFACLPIYRSGSFIIDNVFMADNHNLALFFENTGAQAAGNAAAAVASGQPETAIEHTDYRNKLSEIRSIYHQEVSIAI